MNGKRESEERGETRVKYMLDFDCHDSPSSLSFLIPSSSSLSLSRFPLVHSHRTREYEERVHALSCELEDVCHRLQAAERQAMEPSPLLLQLQSDMSKMKVRPTQWRTTLLLYDLLHSFTEANMAANSNITDSSIPSKPLLDQVDTMHLTSVGGALKVFISRATESE